MVNILLFLIFSFIITGIIIFTQWKNKIHFHDAIGLLLFGVLLSIPFITVEYLGPHLKYYFVILIFIAIELGILFSEKKIKYFHDLIHHNIAELRIVSFFLIAIGFTFSEVSFFIFHSDLPFFDLLSLLPVKTGFALLLHTVLTSAGSLMQLGNAFAESVYETIFKFFSYYLRIAIISTSHYLYTIFTEYQFSLFILPLFILNLAAFFYYKHYIDKKMQLAVKN